jgi:hypothetical protein
MFCKRKDGRKKGLRGGWGSHSAVPGLDDILIGFLPRFASSKSVIRRCMQCSDARRN